MALDVSVPHQTQGQFWIAVLVLAAGFLFTTFALYRNRFAGLSTIQKRHRSRIIGQLAASTPVTYSFPSSDPVADHADNLRHALEAAADRDEIRGQTSIRYALGEMRQAIGEAWRPVTEQVPAWSIRVTEVATVLALTGAMATMTGYVVAILQRDFVTSSPGVWVRRIGDSTVDVLVAGRELLFGFPYFDVVWSLAFAYTIQVWRWAYDHWAAIAAMLVVGAIVFAIVDRRTPEEFHPTVVRDRFLTGLEMTGALLVVWILGLVPAGIGQLAGYPGIGDLVGFGLAMLAVLWYVFAFGRRTVYRIRRVSIPSVATDVADPSRVAYIVVHRVWSLLAIASVPLIVAYLAVLVIEGKAELILRALLTAPPETLAIGAGILLLGLVAAAYLVRETWPDIRTALAETMARQQVHAKLLGRGLPYLLVGFGYVVLYSMTRSIALAGLGAAAIGLVAIGIYHLGRRARYAVDLFEPQPRTPRRILVQAYPPMVDAEDQERRLAVVNGDVQLLRDDVDALLEDVITVANGLCEDGEAPSTVGEGRAEQATRYGLVDEDEIEAKMVERARKHILDELRDESLVAETDIEDASDDVPESVREKVLRWLRQQGYVVRSGDHLQLVRDPFKS